MRPGHIVRLVMYPAAGLLVLLIMAGHWLLFSGEAARFVINRLPARVEGLSLRYKSGTVARGVVLQDVAYKTPALTLSAPELTLRPSLPALLAFRLDIADIGIKALDIGYRSMPASHPAPATGVNITPIRIRHARVEGLVVRINGKAPLQADSVDAAVKLGGATFSFRRLRIARGAAQFDGSGAVSLNAPYDFDSTFRFSALTGDSKPAVMMHGRAHGTQDRLEIAASLSGTGEGNITLVMEPPAGRFKANLDLARLDLAPLTGRAVTLSNARVQASGKFAAYRYSARVVVANPWFDDLNADLKGNGDTAHIELDRGRIDSSQVSLLATGAFVFSPRHLTGKMDGTVSGKPMEANAEVALPDLAGIRAEGRLSVAGNRLEFSSKSPGSIDVKLDAGNLAAFDPRLQGRLAGTGALVASTGGYKLSLSSARLSVAGRTLEQAHAALSSDAVGGAVAMLSVGSVQQGKTRLGGGRFDYAGRDFSSGRITVDWQYRDASLHLASRMGLNHGGISGTVDTGKVRAAGQDWSLASPAGFAVSRGRAKVSAQCWRYQESKICVPDITYAADHLRFSVETARLAFSSFASDRLDVSADIAFGEPSRYRIDTKGMLALPSRKLALEQLQLSLSGSGDLLHYTGNAAFINPWVNGARLSADGTLSPEQVTCKACKLDSPDAAVSATGRYAIAAGRLIVTMTGNWRGRDVHGTADISALPTAPKGSAHAALGANSVALEFGGAGKMRGTLAVPDLTALAPEWRGAIEANARFDSADSSFAFEGRSESLKIAGYRLEKMHIEGTGKGGSIDAAVSVDGTQYAGQPLGGGKITLAGELTDATMRFALELPGGSFNADVKLGYNKGALSGRVVKGAFSVGGQQWRLKSPFDFTAAAGVVVIGDHCWQDGGGHVCLHEAHVAAAQGRMGLSVAGLPLTVDHPWFAPDVDIDGSLEASLVGSVDARSGKPMFQATMQLNVPEAQLAYGKGTPRKIGLVAAAEIHDNRLVGNLSARSKKGDRFAASLQIPDVLHAGAFDGKVTLDTDDLGTVAAFIPQVDNAKGTLRASIGVDRLVKPMTASVSVKVSNGASVDIPLAGVTFGDLDLTADGDARKIAVNLSATSGAGKGNATGTITDLFTDRRKATFAVKGTGMTMLRRPDMNLVASPDVTVTDDANGNLNISGRFEVDDGNFKSRELGEQARRPSSDVVVVSGEGKSAPAGGTNIHLDVVVKQFDVDMYGLKSGVAGAVLLTQQGMSPRRAQGTLNLVKGTFSRYGQTFDIDRGRLIFSGPLDNPLVDVVSSRTITDPSNPNNPIKVSLTLSGPANDIKSTISSDPPMSGANALAYLVLGRPLTSTTGKDSQALSGAALALGLKQALPITGQIQSALGLSELSLSSNGVDSTSVIAGKRIGPDLYVEYDYDVFSRIGGILFNYRLTSRLSLETRTGEANSMQLIYSF